MQILLKRCMNLAGLALTALGIATVIIERNINPFILLGPMLIFLTATKAGRRMFSQIVEMIASGKVSRPADGQP